MGMWDDDDDDDVAQDHPADTIADKLGLERQPFKMRRRSQPASGQQPKTTGGC